MTVNEASIAIAKRIKLAQQEDFDNVGLLCGNPHRDVTGILVSHDTLENVVDEAIAKGFNFICSFHPILFSPLKSLTGKNYVEKVLMKAIENKIAIFAVHTAFDNDYFGVNFGMCEQLKLQHQKVLMPKTQTLQLLQVYVPHDYSAQVKDALFKAGAGNIGFYDECSFSVRGEGSFRPIEGSNPFSGKTGVRENADEVQVSVIFERYKLNRILAAMKSAHPYEEVAHQIISIENDNQYLGLGRFGELETAMGAADFLEYVKIVFGLKVVRHSAFPSGKIKRVGVLGGSGAVGIRPALAQHCDAFLTGDIKYHDFFAGEGRMLICDIGHYESEQYVVQQLFEILSEIFPKFAISKSLVPTNPVNYFL